ncbi:hypothetical protein [Hydrogenimonas sp. SS33]|uniref:hypothetical protein n=1 Tax=Hydrogenimonas leucolamina TaxID=2954236 RepID=UPI00336BDBE5
MAKKYREVLKAVTREMDEAIDRGEVPEGVLKGAVATLCRLDETFAERREDVNDLTERVVDNLHWHLRYLLKERYRRIRKEDADESEAMVDFLRFIHLCERCMDEIVAEVKTCAAWEKDLVNPYTLEYAVAISAHFKTLTCAYVDLLEPDAERHGIDFDAFRTKREVKV